MKYSFIDGSDGKVSSSDRVDPSASGSEGEGANVHVNFLTTVSELEQGTRNCVGVVSTTASWAYEGGQKTLWAGKEVTRAPCGSVEVPGTHSSGGEGNKAFCIEVSGSNAVQGLRTHGQIR